jgi:hypothetical protein
MRIFATSRPTDKATPQALTADMAAEVEAGKGFYREGLIVQAYMDPDYTRTFMILEAPSVEAAKARFDIYPQVREGLIVFDYTPLIGMPAVAQVHEVDGSPLPDWWPAV